MQLATGARVHLEERLAGGEASLQNSMQFHTLILLFTARNWTDYLEHLDAQLTELVCTIAPSISTVPFHLINESMSNVVNSQNTKHAKS